MTTNTSDETNGGADITSENPTGPETSKPARKHRMARETAARPAAMAVPSPTTGAEPPASPSSLPPPIPSKLGTIVTLLRRDNGATLAEMIASTGWLPHTTRAMLTGLRKKGHVIERAKRDEVTVWRIVGAA